MPTKRQLQKHVRIIKDNLKTVESTIDSEYTTIRTNCGDYKVLHTMDEGLNCCGVGNLQDFYDLTTTNWTQKKQNTVMTAVLEYAKHLAWEQQRSLIYASIEMGQQGGWAPIFEACGYIQEYKVKNRNTDNVIAVFSFDLTKWVIE